MKIIITLSLSLLCAAISFAADSARVVGDLKVDGIHFSDSSTISTANDLLKNKGTWESGKLYSAGDVVQAQSGSYVCITANTAITPPNASYWSVLGIQGVKGDTGASGPVGPAGGPALTVKDGNGVTLGTWMGFSSSGDDLIAYLSNGLIYQIDASRSIWRFPQVYIFFSEQNCTGNAYIELYNLLPQRLFTGSVMYGNSVAGQSLYKPSGVLPVLTLFKSMIAYNGVCENSAPGSSTKLSPAVQVGIVPSDPIGPFTIQ